MSDDGDRFSELSPGLRALLDEARSEDPRPAELERVRARLGPLLGPGSGGGGAAQFSTLRTAGLAIAAAAAIVIVTGLSVGGRASLEHRPGPVPLTGPAVTSTQANTPPAPAAAVELPDPLFPPAAPRSASPARRPSRSRAAASAPTTARSGAEVDDESAGELEHEASLVEEARRALRTEPARSLSLCREHERRFPRGTLALEARVIEIEALAGLGRGEEARARARGFFAAHPGTAYRHRIERALGAGRE